jgi:integrase
MNHEELFDVRRFENRNGVSSWRVSGWLHGVRIRRNFKSREEAAAGKAALEIKAEQDTPGLRSITTRLTAEQASEAEAVFRRLEGRSRSLGFYVDYALATYRDPIHDRTLGEASKHYLEVRASDEIQGQLSHRQMLSFRWELRALESAFRGKTVSELSADALTGFLKRGLASKKTYNNRRGLIGPFLKFCLLKDWIATNPIDRVPHFRGIGHRRGSAPTLSASQCAEIMEWAENESHGALIPFIALCLFAGIRPDPYVGEIAKLEPKHVRVDTGVILIEPEVSKVRMKRAVAIQPNLAAWLAAYPLDRYPIMPRGFRRLRLKFRKRFNLSHDILRHTFVSMFVAKFRSMGEAALQAGNSESIIRKHYLDLKTPAEAEAFFNIRPQAGQSIVALPRVV